VDSAGRSARQAADWAGRREGVRPASVNPLYGTISGGPNNRRWVSPSRRNVTLFDAIILVKMDHFLYRNCACQSFIAEQPHGQVANWLAIRAKLRD